MSGTRGGSNDATLPLIATDTVAGEAYQRVKLDVGDAGASVPVVGALPVSATDLDIRSLSGTTDKVGIWAWSDSAESMVQAMAESSGVLMVSIKAQPDGGLVVVPHALHGIDSGQFVNEVFVAGGGSASDSEPGGVNEGEAVRAYFDTNGYQHVKTDRGPICGSGAKTNVSASASSVTVLTGNATRRGATVYNDSTVALYLDLSGGTASTTSFSVKIAADGYYEVPFGYTGPISGIWASATGSARVTEMTA